MGSDVFPPVSRPGRRSGTRRGEASARCPAREEEAERHGGGPRRCGRRRGSRAHGRRRRAWHSCAGDGRTGRCLAASSRAARPCRGRVARLHRSIGDRDVTRSFSRNELAVGLGGVRWQSRSSAAPPVPCTGTRSSRRRASRPLLHRRRLRLLRHPHPHLRLRLHPLRGRTRWCIPACRCRGCSARRTRPTARPRSRPGSSPQPGSHLRTPPGPGCRWNKPRPSSSRPCSRPRPGAASCRAASGVPV